MIIFSNDIISVADSEVTAQSTTAGYAKKNVMDLTRLKRRWRMNALTKSDSNPVLRFDLSSAKTVVAVFLNDVNFDKVVIKGHASDLGTDWSGASFSSSEIAVSLDAQVGRYKVFIPLTAFSYRWLAVIVPAAAAAVGSYIAKWEIGTVVILGSVDTFTRNMSYGYERGAEQSYSDISMRSKHRQRVEYGEIQWVATLQFGSRNTNKESDLTTLNTYGIADELVFFENESDTSRAYLCYRDDHYSGTLIYMDIVSGGSLRLKELV